MWAEFPDDIAVEILATIRDIREMKAERVECDKRWKKYYKKNNKYPWRLYFRKCNDGKYNVLVSDKSSQNMDWKWLQLQENC